MLKQMGVPPDFASAKRRLNADTVSACEAAILTVRNPARRGKGNRERRHYSPVSQIESQPEKSEK